LRNRLVVGREPSCDIVIADRQVSRQHARLMPTASGVTLEDLGSKNGTHHNGQLLTRPMLLEDGDIIQIALVQQFVYLSSDATVPLDSEIFLIPMHEPEKTSPHRLRLEKRSRRVWIGDVEVLPPLSASQFRLLELLYDNSERVLPRQELIMRVWGEEQAVDVSEQALDALIRRLRERLGSIDPTHAYIVTIRGHGVRLDNPTLE
jgi:DNA-binding winged helix-turn-helix (wHTH) protein